MPRNSHRHRSYAARLRWLGALPIVGVIAALSLIAVLTLSSAGSSDAGGRERIFDLYQRLSAPVAPAPSPFHLVEIDRESIAEVGPWPWPRTVLAGLVDSIAAAGARAIILVEPVDAPDPLSPEVIGAFWLEGAGDRGLAAELERLPSTDDVLGRALAGAASIAAVAGGSETAGDAYRRFARADAAAAPAGLSVAVDTFALPAAEARFAVSPAITASARLAVAALPADPDGVIRRAPTLWSVDAVPTPSIALEAARLAAGGDLAIRTSSSAVNAAGPLVEELTLGATRLPVEGGASIRFAAPRRLQIPATSAAKVLAAGARQTQLADSVVLIGLDKDIGAAAMLRTGKTSIAEAHAVIASQLLEGRVLSRPVWIGYIEALSVMLFGAVAIMWAQRVDFWKAVWLAACFSLLVFAASYAAFALKSVLFDPLPGAAALFLGAFSVAGGRTLGVALRDDAMRGAFQGALPEAALKALREGDASSVLKGVRRDVSVLACELRLLESDAEALAQRPDDVAGMFAAAANALRETIVRAGGAADQADGGKIYAYFNAPLQGGDHLQAACSAALRLVESMDRINDDLDASGRLAGVQLHLAVGVASGPCFAGPMGSGRQQRYSVIGPAVEEASFLRRQAEYYGPAVICNDAVYRQTHHHFAFLELDRVRPREDAAPIGLYALVGNPFIKSSKSFRSLDETHRDMLAAYRTGDFATAREYLQKVRKFPGAGIPLFDIYEARIARYAGAGVAPDAAEAAAPTPPEDARG